MKKLLFVAFILLLAVAAFGAETDRDILIAPDGTVFSVASELSDDGYSSSLALTIQSGDKSTRSVVPDSIDNGTNSHPVLAYDADSKTLFLFWQRIDNDATSDLLIASYAKDTWAPATVIDSKSVARFNLNVAITRSVRQLERDGTVDTVPALVLHAAWWEEGAGSQGAHYAVMGLRGGAVVDPDVHDMSEFQRDDNSDTPLNQNFVRQVALLDGPTPDSVDVLYADPHSKSFYRSTLRPIVEGRLHIPVGVKSGHLGGPKALGSDWAGQTGVIGSHDGSTVIFYNVAADKVSYIQVNGTTWADTQQVTLAGKVTADAVVSALANKANAGTAAAQ